LPMRLISIEAQYVSCVFSSILFVVPSGFTQEILAACLRAELPC
jgi:hypothetical protein